MVKDQITASARGGNGRGTTATIPSKVASASSIAVLDELMDTLLLVITANHGSTGNTKKKNTTPPTVAMTNLVLSTKTKNEEVAASPSPSSSVENLSKVVTETAAAAATTTVSLPSSSPTEADTTTAVARTATVATKSTATTTTTSASNVYSCSHGSTLNHFSDVQVYRDAIKEFLLLPDKEGWEEKFHHDHPECFTDLKFSQYIFALCTSWYLKDRRNAMTFELRILLDLGTAMKYIYVPLKLDWNANPDLDQVQRYHRELFTNDDRGVINRLSRETKSYCNCMQDKKEEATGMAKMGRCNGCKHTFLRNDMKKCDGCKFAMFCTEDCQVKSWPAHKMFCTTVKKMRSDVVEHNTKG